MFSRKLRLIIDLKLNGLEDKEVIYSADEIGEGMEAYLAEDGKTIQIKSSGVDLNKAIKKIDAFLAIPVFKTTCACCGEKINEGYYNEDDCVTYCSEECLENELNAEFGEGNWREATEEEVATVRESGEGGFFYAKADGEEDWINLPIYWVDYTEEDE